MGTSGAVPEADWDGSAISVKAAMRGSRLVEPPGSFLYDTLQVFRPGNLATLEHSQSHLFRQAIQVSAKQWPNSATDRAQPRKALPIVIMLKPHLPHIRHVLPFTVFRSNSVVNVVTDFMEEHVRQPPLADERNSQPPSPFPTPQGIVYEYFDPCGITARSEVIRTACTSQADLAFSRFGPSIAAFTRKAACIGEHHRIQPHQIVRGHRIKHSANNWQRIKRRVVIGKGNDHLRRSGLVPEPFVARFHARTG